jgi:hypothetical protein
MKDRFIEEENNGYVVFNKISKDQLGNRILMRGGRGVTPPTPPFLQQAS